MMSTLARRRGAIKSTAAALAAAALLLSMRLLPLSRLTEVLNNWIEGLGVWGPVVYALIYIVATLAFVPGLILTIGAGTVFGLLTGTIVVSIGSTIGACLAFLIARYVARGRVEKAARNNRTFKAVDRALGEGGWKVVVLLRLSPAIPFNLQNYLYGLTPIRFWEFALASWLAMLPGTFMYVYIGYTLRQAGASLTGERETTVWEWVLLGVGLAATIAVTLYITRLARQKLREHTEIEPEAADEKERAETPRGAPWKSLAALAGAVLLVVAAGVAQLYAGSISEFVVGALGLPPQVERKEAAP